MGLIELRNITFAYETGETPVFDDFSISIDEGRCLIVKGDNGTGKTTLLRILNGLSFPQRGSYLFDKICIDEKYLKDGRNSKTFHKRIGYLFQNPDIMLFNAKVYDEIAFGPRQMGISDDEVKERTDDCMRICNLSSLSDKAPYHLSEGQKKRVALAAVMALNPDVYVLDEPSAGLDAKSRDWLIELLASFKDAKKTLVIVTHDDAQLEALGDDFLKLP